MSIHPSLLMADSMDISMGAERFNAIRKKSNDVARLNARSSRAWSA
jgi:hypothetical protein